MRTTETPSADDSSIGWIVALIVILAVIVTGFVWVHDAAKEVPALSPLEQKIQKYRVAEQLCGKDNVKQFINVVGFDEFDCIDYSKI